MMSMKSIMAIKNNTLTELEKIRSLSFTVVGQNNILAFFAFNILLAAPTMSRAKLVSILGEDIPKQVISKARKVAKYVKDGTSYNHNGQSIYLKAIDFQSINKAQPTRSVLTTYGHIERHEAQVKKDLDALLVKTLKDFNDNS